MQAEPPRRPAIRGAAGAVDISARAPTRLAGFAGRNELVPRDGEPLLASAVVFRDDAGRSQAIVSLDLLFAGPELTQRLRAVAAGELGMRDCDLLVTASHTHFAPPVDTGKPALGAVDAGYLEWVGQQCCDLLRAVAAKPPVPLYGRGRTLQWHGAVYRRRRWNLPHLTRRGLALRGVVRAPDRRRAITRDVRLLELVGEDGSPVAVIWSAACHPSAFPEAGEQSPEYVGVVRERLAAGGELPVIFLQGFAGDLRADAPDARSPARALRALAVGPTFGTFSMAGWRAWAGGLAGILAGGLEALRKETAEPSTGRLGGAIERVPLSEVLEGACEDGRPVEFQRLHIGSLCDIAAVSAEPSSALLPLLDGAELWAVGYSGDVFGYWPSDLQRGEGGYEAGQWIPYFNLRGSLRPGRDRLFRAAFAAAGRDLAADLANAEQVPSPPAGRP